MSSDVYMGYAGIKKYFAYSTVLRMYENECGMLASRSRAYLQRYVSSPRTIVARTTVCGGARPPIF